MTTKKLTEEQEKEIKLLLANNEMLERSKQQASMDGKNDVANRIKIAQDEVVAHIKQIDPNTDISVNVAVEKETPKNNLFTDNDDIFAILKREEMEGNGKVVEDTPIKEAANDNLIKIEDLDININDMEEDVTATKVEEVNETTFNNVDPELQYDIIQLPSNGECYPDKLKRVPVAYLTAYDENFITSPNLYEDGLIIDYLLKHKVMNSNIDVDNLVSGDVDAIMVWLRATSYGADFPIVVGDPETGERIETTVDLTTLKPKEFKLIGDENGYFDFTLPITKKKVKFKYLTRKEEKQLGLVTKIENYGTRAQILSELTNTLMRTVSVDDVISDRDKVELDKAAKIIRRWTDNLKKKNEKPYTRMITNSLQFQIVSIDGETDKLAIRKIINNMPAKDSLSLRRYINENSPGMNFNITVERPESMGGGSFETFLSWDDSVFLNIPELREKS